MAKIRTNPPRKYVVQLLLYGLGYRNLGLPVRRVVLAAYPRTSASLDGLYVWERPFTDPDGALTAENAALLATVFSGTRVRKAAAEALMAGRLRLAEVPSTPDPDECIWCPIFRPQTARDGGPGCPGTARSAGTVS